MVFYLGFLKICFAPGVWGLAMVFSSFWILFRLWVFSLREFPGFLPLSTVHSKSMSRLALLFD